MCIYPVRKFLGIVLGFASDNPLDLPDPINYISLEQRTISITFQKDFIPSPQRGFPATSHLEKPLVCILPKSTWCDDKSCRRPPYVDERCRRVHTFTPSNIYNLELGVPWAIWVQTNTPWLMPLSPIGSLRMRMYMQRKRKHQPNFAEDFHVHLIMNSG